MQNEIKEEEFFFLNSLKKKLLQFKMETKHLMRTKYLRIVLLLSEIIHIYE